MDDQDGQAQQVTHVKTEEVLQIVQQDIQTGLSADDIAKEAEQLVFGEKQRKILYTVKAEYGLVESKENVGQLRTGHT